MTMRDLVDPALLPGLDLMPDFALSAEALPAIREGMAQMASQMPEPPDSDVNYRDESVAGLDGNNVSVRIYTPAGDAKLRPAILHIHGGGYVMGTHLMSHAANLQLAMASEAVVVSVDYRVAPETLAPGSVEDCYAALQWLAAQADALGVDPARIAVRGESAGGGLAAALCLLARDRGGPAIAHQNLIYPMLDDRSCVTDHPAHLGAFIWTPEANRFGWRALLGVEPGSAEVPAYSVPARAETLAGLPSTFIAVGALDLFVVEDLDYARRLLEAGVPTELHVYAGAYHGFDIMADAAPALRMKGEAVAALRQALYDA